MDNQSIMPFQEFELDWITKHRGSIPKKPKVSSAQEYFWIIFWIVVAIGSSVFSGAHTIPASEMTFFSDIPHRDKLAISAFIMVELVIFGAAAGRREIDWLKWLLRGAILVALAGNISSTISAVNMNNGNLINQFGGVLLAIIAPLTALAAGEVLHIQLDKRNEKLRIANEDYRTKHIEMDVKINQAYTRYVNENKPKNNPSNDVNLRKFTEISRPTPKMKLAVSWLQEHPEHLDTESRELGNMIGVSHTLANEARKYVKGLSINGNGFSHDQEN